MLVGDAKWKRNTDDDREPSADDIYQLLSYQLMHDVPGVLGYPEQGGPVSGTCAPPLVGQLALAEVPVTNSANSFSDCLEGAVRNVLDRALPSLRSHSSFSGANSDRTPLL